LNLITGDLINMICFAEIGSARWYHLDLESKPINYNLKLVLDKAKLSNGGNYWCYGKYTDKPEFFLAKTALRMFGNLACLARGATFY